MLVSGIRVTYSGLVSFAISLVSVFTAIFFMTIVTRSLTPQEYGTYSLFINLINYFVIGQSIISFWTSRQIARGENIGKTSFIFSFFFALILIPLYLVISFQVSNSSSVDFNPLIFGIFILPLIFGYQTLNAINLAHKPQTVSYGLFLFELLKIPSGLVIVYFLDLGIEGAILALGIGYFGSIIFQIKYAKHQMIQGFSRLVIKRWIFLSWIPLYNSSSRFIRFFDVLIFTMITGSVIGVAYFSASLTISYLVEHSGKISQAIYPKLLSGGEHKHIQENFTLMMYFAIPLLGITIIFAKPALFILNPLYIQVSEIAIILSLRSFIYILRFNFNQILRGIDNVDIVNQPRFRDLLKSNLFHTSTVNHIFNLVFLSSLIIVIYILISNNSSEIEIVYWWSLVALFSEIPFMLYIIIRTKKHVQFKIEFLTIVKYIFATLCFVLVYLIGLQPLLILEGSIFEFLPKVIALVIPCLLIYFGVTIVIDKKTQIIFKAILKELNLSK